MQNDVENLLPFFQKAGIKLQREFEQYACHKLYGRGDFLAMEGDRCHHFYLVQCGEVRVYKGDDCGREITLYKVKPGESCILSAFSIMNSSPFPAYAVADQRTRIIEIPSAVFRDWLNRHDFWREYIFDLFSGHLAEIISKIESLVFQRVDERIAHFLVNATPRHHNRLQMTHADIARELGTAREVVSRILKDFEKSRFVKLSRGKITILNQQGLINHGRLYSYAG
jgi:CRP/FNR family transcriptional regulator